MHYQNSDNPTVQRLVTQGANAVQVAYDDPESLKSALVGVEVVVSALSIGALSAQAQVPLAEAAKAAGVQLFVPSEYGANTEEVKEGFFLGKAALHTKLQEIGLPYTLFFTGTFPDFVFSP